MSEDTSKLNISYQLYMDKAMGVWMGKSIGGTVGAPFEGHKILGNINKDNCWPERIMPNDDLDIQVVWLELLEEKGPNITREDLVKIWQDRCWYNFAEYGYFLHNVQRGINPPLSGTFNNIYFRESMGCPIRAEIWGLVSPGNPQLAANYARMDGELDHNGFSVRSEQFWAAAIAQAFFAGNLEDALDAGRSVIPENTRVYEMSHDIQGMYFSSMDWRRVWKKIIRIYGNRDCSKADINFAFTLLSLYAGKGDFKDTIVTAINCGWDTDCTAATAGALLGALYGCSQLPNDWKTRMGNTLACDVNVRHKTALISDFSTDTCKVGLEVSLSKNTNVDIADVPVGIIKEVDERISIRKPSQKVIITSNYSDEPVLYNESFTSIILKVEHLGDTYRRGYLGIYAPEGIEVIPNIFDLSLIPDDLQFNIANVRRISKDPIIWDKNLLEARLVFNDGEVIHHTFGLVGARQWKIYGPYWDAWDTTKSKVCPYRNDIIISHPIFVDGCSRVLSHQYARLDREYLDETALRLNDIPEENPFVIERGEDHIDADFVGKYLGESCYYLVREISAKELVECDVNIGYTGPFIVWLDGEEMLRSEESSAWFPFDYSFSAKFNSTPRRMVFKCVRPGDEFRFSLCFVRKDTPGGKTNGISILLDNLGDSIQK